MVSGSGSCDVRQARNPQRRVISRPGPQIRPAPHKHARQRQKSGRRDGSYNCQTKPTHRLTVPKATSLPCVEHSPSASGSRLQLPGGRAADRVVSFPECNTAESLFLLLLSPLLLLFYPSSYGRAGGSAREGTPESAACRVKRWEGDGAGSRGENGRTKGRGERMGG